MGLPGKKTKNLSKEGGENFRICLIFLPELCILIVKGKLIEVEAIGRESAKPAMFRGLRAEPKEELRTNP